jgi:FkbM family methyltransferase
MLDGHPPASLRIAAALRRGVRRSGLHALTRRAGINRFAEQRILRRYATRPDAHVDLEVRGFDLTVPGPTLRWYLYDRYEAVTVDWLARSVRDGWRTIDVGANIGYLSLHLSRLVGPHGQVIACEPIAETADLLERNIRQNDATNVTVVRSAIGAVSTRRVMHLTAAGDLDSFYGSAFGATVEDRIVDVTTVDEVTDGHADFVKIDVEGAELDVLDGMEATIPTARALVVEWNPSCLRVAGRDPRELPQRLLDVGFDVQVLDDGAGSVRELSDVLADLDAKRLDPLWYGNLACTR